MLRVIDTATYRLLWDVAGRIDAEYTEHGEESARSLLNLWLASGEDERTLTRNALLIGYLRELGCPLAGWNL